MQEPHQKKYKIRFYQRTDMIWFLVVVSYLLSFLFIGSGVSVGFTEAELEEGIDRNVAGSLVLAVGLVCLLFAVYETYKLYRCQSPLLILYREGVQIREIGFGRMRVVRPLWEDIIIAEGQVKTLFSLIYTVQQQNRDEGGKEVNNTFGVVYTSDDFGVSLKKVVQALEYYQNNPEVRRILPSWEGWDTVFSGHELPV